MTQHGYMQLARARCFDKRHDRHDRPPCAGCVMDALLDMQSDRAMEGKTA